MLSVNISRRLHREMWLIYDSIHDKAVSQGACDVKKAPLFALQRKTVEHIFFPENGKSILGPEKPFI